MEFTLPQTVRLNSKKIKQIREEKGLTQLYVATVVGVTIDTISRWENKRYPSVKRENALKLAQTLEVDVQDILEEGEEERHENLDNSEVESREERRGPEDDSTTSEKQGLKNVFIVGIMALLFGAGGLFAGYFFFRPSNLPLDISAVRYLPARCAQGSQFPVLIGVNITPQTRRTILLKEDIPRTLKVLKTVPRYTSIEKGLLKWLYQGDTSKLKFVYIAQMPTSVKEGKRLRFKGLVTIKTSQTVNVNVGGNNCVIAAPFHWADKNGDNRIDDEEILDAYQLLSGVKGMTAVLKEVENLWAAGQYKWDKGTKRFIPQKQATKQEAKIAS